MVSRDISCPICFVDNPGRRLGWNSGQTMEPDPSLHVPFKVFLSSLRTGGKMHKLYKASP